MAKIVSDMSGYIRIQPPFTLKFFEMSKKELKAYFKWFQEVTPKRIAQLASVVRSSPGFENWQPDFSPDSLNDLGDWFAGQIETRPRTKEEIDAFNEQARFPIIVRTSAVMSLTGALLQLRA